MNDATLLAALDAQGYAFVERWHTRAVLGFVRREFAHPVWPLKVAFVLLGSLLLACVILGARDLSNGAHWLWDILAPFGLGLLAIAALVVPHELLHGCAFRMLGAPRVVYGAHWRSLVFHAAAPGFPLGRGQMNVVALAPFAVITSLVLGLGVLLGGAYLWAALAALLVHTQGCLGDFAMVNFFARGSLSGEWITYDESGGESFVFLVRPSV